MSRLSQPLKGLAPGAWLAVTAAATLVSLALGTGSACAVWQLVWSDEFDGTNVDASKWTFETGNGQNGWGNSEREYYTGGATNTYVTNGVLHIVVRQQSMGGFPYTSARMKTQGLYSKLYGRIEFRASLPQGLGFWPALWLLGNNISSAGWPACGEIDVMENNQSLGNQVQGTLHYSDTSNNHLSQTRVYALPGGASVTNFHTYAIEWTTNSIKWLVDSNLVQTWTSWSSSTGPYPAPYNQPFFLLMNVAVGGSYVGYPTDAQINAGTVFPGEMQVDYVRVYDDLPATTPPSAPTGLSAAAGSAKAFLTWDLSSGATGYKVKRATTGGGYTTVATTATNNYLDAALSPCTAYDYVVSATNALGESSNSSPTSVALGSYALAINSGGGAVAQFLADANVTGGTQATPVTTLIDTSGVTGPAPQAVYQTERYGNFTYAFTGLTAGVSYRLRLHFAETYWSSVGQRRFNVFINGTQVLTNFDIIAAAGAANKATIQEFTATPSSGQITVQYATVTDNAKSSGIELLLPPPTAPTVGNNSPIYAGSTLNLSASTIPGATYSWSGPNGFSSASQNPSIPDANTNAAGFYSVTITAAGCSAGPVATAVTINPLALSWQETGGAFKLVWPAGTLQSATNLGGPWLDVPSAISPLSIDPTDPQQFYRVKN